MKISNSLAATVLLVALICAGFFVYWKVNFAQEHQNIAEAVVSDALPYQTEEAWTVGQIAQILAGFGDFNAKIDRGPLAVKVQLKTAAGAMRVYGISHAKTSGEISMSGGVWNPETYLDWSRGVLPKEDAVVPLVSDAALAELLLNPATPIFLDQNRRLSDFLSEHTGSGRGHLQAALLLGTMGLNEHAGSFSDTRPALNRMVAHMVAARAGGISKLDPAYRLAEAVRLTLCGQQRDALAEMDGWKDLMDSVPQLRTWEQVLRLRNTLDWRGLEKDAQAGPLALRREYFRALMKSMESSFAVNFLRSLDGEPEVGYWLIANEEVGDMSVTSGHLFSKPAVVWGVREAAVGARGFGVEPVKDSLGWLKEYLDTPEGLPVTAAPKGGGVVLEVAGRNFMAARHQRQLMHGFYAAYAFLQDSWGVKKDAADFKEFVVRKLPELRYKPFLIRKMARTDEERADANRACVEVIREMPQMVTPTLWESLRDKGDNGTVPQGMPNCLGWFFPPIPEGTAYNAGCRVYENAANKNRDKAWVQALWEQAPYDYSLGWLLSWNENGQDYKNMKPEILEKRLGPLTKYYYDAAMKLARSCENQPDKYTEAMKTVVELNPGQYLTMGNYFLDRDDEKQAAESFKLAYEKSPDRVRVANNIIWWVKYLHRTGDKVKAVEVAKEAAEVYSYAGLETYLWYAETEKQWEEARATAKKLDERYNDGRPVEEFGFLQRYSHVDKAKADEWGHARLVNKLFPEGLKAVKLSDFTNAPEKGVLISGFNNALASFQLKPGEVIVALDGFQTESLSKYMTIRAFSKDERLSLIVWNGKSYRICEGELQKRTFGVKFVDYPAAE